MNFFEQQDQARKSTRLLVGLFGLSVAAMTGCIYLATIVTMGVSPLSRVRCQRAALPESIAIVTETNQNFVHGASRTSKMRAPELELYKKLNTLIVPGQRPFRGSRDQSLANFDSPTSDFSSLAAPQSLQSQSYSPYRSDGSRLCSPGLTVIERGWWHPQLLFWVTFITGSIIGAASLHKISQLKQGGIVIVRALGGELLLPKNADNQGQLLLNVVEEMAIAAGISVPHVYILNHEHEINAFAAGFDAENAVIGVTRGSLDQLTRDELQGVIGHEFSHILNGDMRLNIQIMGLLHGILFIYLAGRLLSSGRYGRHHSVYILGFFLMSIGGMGLLCGRLIQSAVSRQREFLADASAVQFTRNPNGIGGALEKLAGIGSRLRSPHAQAASHMFFGNAMGFAWAGDMFATHPPLFQRIEKIRGVRVSGGALTLQTSSTIQSGMMGFAGASGSGSLAPDQVVQQVGTVTPAHYAHAQGLLAQLPESVRTAIREPQGAIATIYALFLESENPALRDQQVQQLSETESENQLAQVLEHDTDIRFLDPRLRLPLLDLAIPALRQCPPEQLQSLLDGVEDLAIADGEWSMREFVLFLVLQQRLDAVLFPHREARVQHQALEQILPDCFAVLSALASAGNTQPEAIAYAFRCGAFKLPGATSQSVPETPPAWSLDTLPQHLEQLRQAAPKLKQSVINACAHTVLLDSEVTVQEAELLRAVTITLDCPIPPFLNAARVSKSAAKGI
jgi:Zn-dependent protease with chaperone function